MFRIGFGYDVHQLAENRKLILGGIEIPYHKGTLGHSDGDALIHAICDALFGALALRDIGFHFPDTAGEFKDIDSKILLTRTMEIIRQKGWEIGNIDTTICLEQPKLKDYIPLMQTTLAKVLAIEPGQVSIKATTTEKMGFVGTSHGVAVYAVVLLTNT
ncbi:MAG: 2-C-methyl-D-erythritol 2,4-cyclodiphosphate synthase [Bacteroidetes bacterium GWF2_49_14]|nr:MAG: 2-C-methyl-D-erythritol 2,4-cyclodiphosphate synthase [Bacteroidetes bacterium GWF2_49_14]